jgi:tetratricopeptide (TPR) repeat protein
MPGDQPKGALQVAATTDDHNTEPTDAGSGDPGAQQRLESIRIAFLGRLASMSRRDATRLVRQHGGSVAASKSIASDAGDHSANWLVLGEETFPNPALVGTDDSLDDDVRTAISGGEVEVVSETDLWQRLGLVERQDHIQRLHTPAMLAELLGVPVQVIRRWHRRGLIVPEREVRRLAYFDFREVATARRLAELLAAGMTPAVIEARLADVCRLLPDVERPLEQLSVIAEGKDLLLRRGGGLIDSGGQRRFDFVADQAAGDPTLADPTLGDQILGSQAAEQAFDNDSERTTDESPVTTMKLPEMARRELGPSDLAALDAEALIELAAAAEDCGDMARAIELYRSALSAGGPSAELCFRAAELLYCQNELTAARERYYMAIELDEDFVEARWNLGCVLAELGDRELAVAAFEGALAFHADYPDAHYHLARTLDELGRPEQADSHWRSFLELAPDSPWAHLARQRLGVTPPV